MSSRLYVDCLALLSTRCLHCAAMCAGTQANGPAFKCCTFNVRLASQVLCSDGVVYTAGQNRGGACGREKGPNPKDWAKMFTKVAPAPLPPGVTGLKLVAGTVKCA